MCGIVGIAGEIGDKENIIFRTLLDLDVIRGRDSTGVVKVGKTPGTKTLITKALGPPSNLIETCNLISPKGVFYQPSKCLIGHNRAATMGNITVENAHPFRFDHIYGVHNGTLRDWVDLEGWLEYDVDSKALYKNLSKHGAEDTWGKFTGAAALVWWDEKENSVNLVRNTERPLFLARLNEGRTLVWASEEWMIKASVLAANKELDKEFNNGLENPFYLKAHSLHTFTIGRDFKPKLEGVKDLKPRYEPPFRNNVVGFVHRNKPQQINIGWAKKLPRGGKELIGTEFVFTKSVSFQRYPVMKSGLLHVNVGETEDGTEVYVFPVDMEDWDFYRDLVYEPGMQNNVYKISRRPRLKTQNGKQVLCVALDGIQIVEGIEVEDYYDYDYEEEKKLKSLGSQCGFCCTPLDIKDYYTYLCNDQAVVCKDCEHMKETFR